MVCLSEYLSKKEDNWLLKEWHRVCRSWGSPPSTSIHLRLRLQEEEWQSWCWQGNVPGTSHITIVSSIQNLTLSINKNSYFVNIIYLTTLYHSASATQLMQDKRVELNCVTWRFSTNSIIPIIFYTYHLQLYLLHLPLVSLIFFLFKNCKIDGFPP